MKTRKKTVIGGVLKTLSILIMLMLWLSLIAIIIPPHYFPLLGLATLGLPVFFMLHLLFLIWFVYRGDKLMWVLLLTSFFTIPSFHSWVSLGSTNNSGDASPDISLMTYNVRMFNAYKWIKDVDVIGEQKKIIHQADVDVLALQEYYKFDKTPSLDFPHSFIKYTNPSNNFGLAIFSKLPIIDTGSVAYKHTESFNNYFIFTDVLLNSDTIRIVNVHLASFYFDVKDFEALKEANVKDINELRLRFTSVIKRLFVGFSERSKQLKTLKAFLKESPYPIILCGDMNDAPASYTYRVFNRLLDDAFSAAGRGIGRTYVESWFPLRIDWVFFDPNVFKPVHHEVLSKDQYLSDHRPVVVGLKYNEQ